MLVTPMQNKGSYGMQAFVPSRAGMSSLIAVARSHTDAFGDQLSPLE